MWTFELLEQFGFEYQKRSFAGRGSKTVAVTSWKPRRCSPAEEPRSSVASRVRCRHSTPTFLLGRIGRSHRFRCSFSQFTGSEHACPSCSNSSASVRSSSTYSCPAASSSLATHCCTVPVSSPTYSGACYSPFRLADFCYSAPYSSFS